MTATHSITVQPSVQAYMESLGPPGREWLAALPGIVGERLEAWRLRLGGAFGGGIGSYVCRVRTPDDEPAVLKLALPGPWLEAQVRTLIAADGHGYVRLLRTMPTRALSSWSDSVSRSMERRPTSRPLLT